MGVLSQVLDQRNTQYSIRALKQSKARSSKVHEKSKRALKRLGRKIKEVDS